MDLKLDVDQNATVTFKLPGVPEIVVTMPVRRAKTLVTTLQKRNYEVQQG